MIVEQTAVEPAGRITHCCLGLYSDAVKPREPSGIKSGRNRWFVDSPLEGSGFELPVPRCALIANRAALVAPPAGGVGHLTRARWLTVTGARRFESTFLQRWVNKLSVPLKTAPVVRDVRKSSLLQVAAERGVTICPFCGKRDERRKDRNHDRNRQGPSRREPIATVPPPSRRDGGERNAV